MKKHRKSRRVYKKKRNYKLYFTVFALTVLLGGIAAWVSRELLGQKASQDWYEAKSVSIEGGEISLPKDDAPHPEAKSEWWAYHGRLTTESGKSFSFDYSTVLTEESKGQGISNIAFNNSQSGQHYTHQFKNAANPGFGLENTFYFSTGESVMQGGGDGVDHLKAVAKDFAFDLTLKGQSSPVLHGKNGAVSMGELGNSYYYSRTRLMVAGTVEDGGNVEPVRGVAWFDHQWGDFTFTKLSWDWFGLQLADGSDIMIYQIRNQANKPVYAQGSLSRNNATDMLTTKDFMLTPGVKWGSAKTGVAYPIEWKIVIPDKNIDLVLRSIVKNNEFDARASTGKIYWEGALSVQGTHVGQGFMRLQGYSGKN